jgi:hypothetical protein
LAGNPLVSLSEEQLSDCDPYDCGVFGMKNINIRFSTNSLTLFLQVVGLAEVSSVDHCYSVKAKN